MIFFSIVIPVIQYVVIVLTADSVPCVATVHGQICISLRMRAPMMCPGMVLWFGVTLLGLHFYARGDLCTTFKLELAIACIVFVLEVIRD